MSDFRRFAWAYITVYSLLVFLTLLGVPRNFNGFEAVVIQQCTATGLALGFVALFGRKE